MVGARLLPDTSPSAGGGGSVCGPESEPPSPPPHPAINSARTPAATPALRFRQSRIRLIDTPAGSDGSFFPARRRRTKFCATCPKTCSNQRLSSDDLSANCAVQHILVAICAHVA